MCVLAYLPKLKRGLGLVFVHIFCLILSKKYSLKSTEKVSMPYLFSFTGYQAKCVTKFLFRQLMTSQRLRFIFNDPLKQWVTTKIEGKTDIQKFAYLETEKSFLDEIKSISQNYL